jgi:hypothetical protein
LVQKTRATKPETPDSYHHRKTFSADPTYDLRQLGDYDQVIEITREQTQIA